MYRMTNIFVMVFLALLSAFIVVVFYLAVIENNPPFQKPPIDFLEMPIKVEKDTYRPGDTILLHIKACRHTDVPFTVYRTFRDGLIFAVPPLERSGSPVGCFDSNLPVEIPEALPVGNYYLFGRTVYQVNLLSERVVEWQTEPFIVTD